MRYTYKDYLRDHPVVKKSVPEKKPAKVEVEVKAEEVPVVEEAPVVETFSKRKPNKKPVED